MRDNGPRVLESQRDIGLIRALGPWALAASIVSMIVGAGIFAVPAALAASVGPYAPVAFLACGLAVGSSLAIAALYIAGCAASWLLARRGVAMAGPPLSFRRLGAATVIGIASMASLIALGSPQEIIGLASLIGLSSVAYLIQSRSAGIRK